MFNFCSVQNFAQILFLLFTFKTPFFLFRFLFWFLIWNSDMPFEYDIIPKFIFLTCAHALIFPWTFHLFYYVYIFIHMTHSVFPSFFNICSEHAMFLIICSEHVSFFDHIVKTNNWNFISVRYVHTSIFVHILHLKKII